MDRNSNTYTFIFAIVMVVVMGTGLAYTALSLAPYQKENQRQDKMQKILSTIGITTDRASAPAKYEKYITQELVLNNKGEVLEGVKAFSIDLSKEMSKSPSEQKFPLYVAEVEGEKFYIIPMRGSGLWDAIWGNISLESDLNTIAGASFGHAGETPGLGAEIVKSWFSDMFKNEKIYDEQGQFVGVKAVKGYSEPNNNGDHKVDTISGATITSDGVSAMIFERLKHYVAYFNKLKNVNVASTK